MNKVVVIPLSQNFLRRLAEEIVREHHCDSDPLALSKITVLLPHRRGAVYLRHYLFELICITKRKPFLPPRILTIEDFVNELAVTMEEPPRRPLSPADQAWVLYNIVRENGIYGRIATSWDRFFAWGIRLAELMEKIDRELVTPRDIPYPEDVPAEAGVLLERLKDLYDVLDSRLAEKCFTTEGKRFRLVAERAQDAAVPDGPRYLAGFYALTRSEEKLFRHLFSSGARILWHADASNLPPLYERWRRDWGLALETSPDDTEVSPHIHFHEAYDLHAELRHVQELLPEKVGRPDECSLVLPDPSALVPTLYAAPQAAEVNISLGYPLERTALAALLEQLMTLEQGRDAEGAYYHQDYMTLIRHPYVRRLATPNGNEGRIVLHLLEEKIRQYGKPFLQEPEIVDLLAVSEDPERDRNFLAAEGLDLDEAQAHVSQVHQHVLSLWQGVRTPMELAIAAREVVRFLFVPFLAREDFLREHILDNEFVYALEDRVIPTLEEALFSTQSMEKKLLFALLKQIIHMARAPFEGHPLVGLQVLGLLETRLLSFEKVIVIDVNEDVVPAHEEVNPLLPEPLKAAVGLPGREKEEAITRYHFERLIRSANEVHLLWQSATVPASSGLEGKKVRSRFIEGLLWEQERNAGRLLNDAVTRAPLAISPESFLRDEGLTKTSIDRQRVEDFLRARSAKTGLSATLLNRYLTCPLQFYYTDILGLAPAVSVTEDVDATELGMIIHQTLEDYFAPYKKKTYVPAKDKDPDRLLSAFGLHFRESAMYRCLPPERRFFLEHAAEHRLKSYLEQISTPTFINGLEEDYRLVFRTELGDLSLFGKVDRIDIRDDFKIVLDYKTGYVYSVAKSHFEKRLLPFPLPEALDYDGLRTLKGVIGDFQLPLYVLLVSSGKKEELSKTLSAYVELSKQGEEQYFISRDRAEGWMDAYVSWYAETFPALLCYLITHMAEASHFYSATDEQTCRFCDYESVCRFSYG